MTRCVRDSFAHVDARASDARVGAARVASRVAPRLARRARARAPNRRARARRGAASDDDATLADAAAARALADACGGVDALLTLAERTSTKDAGAAVALARVARAAAGDEGDDVRGRADAVERAHAAATTLRMYEERDRERGASAEE